MSSISKLSWNSGQGHQSGISGEMLKEKEEKKAGMWCWKPRPLSYQMHRLQNKYNIQTVQDQSPGGGARPDPTPPTTLKPKFKPLNIGIYK